MELFTKTWKRHRQDVKEIRKDVVYTTYHSTYNRKQQEQQKEHKKSKYMNV